MPLAFIALVGAVFDQSYGIATASVLIFIALIIAKS